MAVDLLICIRCHKHLDFVLDTWNSVRANTDPRTTDVVFAVDAGNTGFAESLRRIVGHERVYESPVHCGWGAGLYLLLCESIKHFQRAMPFIHFQSIDYDTLYLAPGADRKVLNLICSESVGLLGCYRNTGTSHWQGVFEKQRDTFTRLYGAVPVTYKLGENVSGSFMTLSAELIYRMQDRGMFSPPWSCIKDHIRLADDHFLPMLVRMCGLEIVDVSEFSKCQWRADAEPQGIEKQGILVFHPTKISPKNISREVDIRVRNYYRAIRKESRLS